MGDVRTDEFRRHRRRRQYQLAVNGAPPPTALIYAWACVWRMDDVEPSSDMLQQLREPYDEFKALECETRSYGELEEHAYRLLQRFTQVASETGDAPYLAAWSDVLAGRDPEHVPAETSRPAKLMLNGEALGRPGLF